MFKRYSPGGQNDHQCSEREVPDSEGSILTSEEKTVCQDQVFFDIHNYLMVAFVS